MIRQHSLRFSFEFSQSVFTLTGWCQYNITSASRSRTWMDVPETFFWHLMWKNTSLIIQRLAGKQTSVFHSDFSTHGINRGKTQSGPTWTNWSNNVIANGNLPRTARTWTDYETQSVVSLCECIFLVKGKFFFGLKWRKVLAIRVFYLLSRIFLWELPASRTLTN